MTAVGKVAVVEEPRGIDLPLWRELFTPWDYLRLKASPVYYGFGIPHGHGAPVVVVPGFLGSDVYLLELYFWLWRIGYTPYFSHIGHVAECLDLLTHRLLRTVQRAHRQTHRPVHLIGHSLGGVLCRGAATILPNHVAGVITLGSPFRGITINPWVLRAVRAVQTKVRLSHLREKGCLTPHCSCGFSATMRSDFPTTVRQLAVYTKSDGVVHWQNCLSENEAYNREVCGTHIGLVWNPEVYRIIAEELSVTETETEKAAAPFPRNGKNGKARRTRKRAAVRPQVQS
jgi:pimeloyl-ACP methyl ester carboxylesterase